MRNEKWVIPIALFAIVILLFQNNIDKVFAITVTQVTHNLAGGGTVYSMPSISSYIIRSTGGVNYKVVNGNTFAVTSINLPTPSNGQLYGTEFNCSGTTCQVYEVKPASSNDAYAVEFTALTGAVTSNTTLPLSTGSGGDITSYATTGTSSKWFNAFCTSGNTVLVKSDLTRMGECAGTMNFAVSTVRDVKVDGTLTAVTSSSAGTTGFTIWTGTTRTCVLTVGTTAGDIQRRGSEWLVKNGNSVIRISNSCVNLGSLSTGLTNIYGLEINTSRGEIYVRGDQKVQVMNSTDYTKLYSVDLLDNVAPVPQYHNEAVISSLGQLGVRYHDSGANTGRLKLTIFNLGAPPEEEEGQPAVSDCSDPLVVCSDFCETPGNEFLLRCRNEANGGSPAFGNNTAFNPIGGTNDQIVSALGLSNSDIKTNGVGYLLLAVTLLLFNTLWLLSVFVGMNKGIIIPYPIYISALISIAIISAFVLMEFTDPLILILGVVALVALTAPRIISIIQSRGGGGSE